MAAPRRGRSATTDRDIFNLARSTQSLPSAATQPRNLVSRVSSRGVYPEGQAFNASSSRGHGVVDARKLAANPTDGFSPNRRLFPPRPAALGALDARSIAASVNQQTGSPAFRSRFPPRNSAPLGDRQAAPGPRTIRRPGFSDRKNARGGQRSRRRGGNYDNTSQAKEDWEADELDYLEKKLQSEQVNYQEFTPDVVNLETLAGLGPAVAVSEWGLSEVVGDKLIRLEKTEELEKPPPLARLTRRAPSSSTVAAHESSAPEQKDQDKAKRLERMAGPRPLTAQRKGSLVKDLLSGHYPMMDANQSKGRVIDGVWKYGIRNETYHTRNASKLVKKVARLVPASGG